MAIAGTENVIIDSNFLAIMLEHLSVLSVRSKLLMGVGVQQLQLSVQLMLFQVSVHWGSSGEKDLQNPTS
jgi:hypothetical protein